MATLRRASAPASGCPASTAPTNGSYILSFHVNATDLDLDLARLAINNLFSGNITGELPGYGPFGTVLQATIGDRFYSEAVRLPGMSRVTYDLPA